MANLLRRIVFLVQVFAIAMPVFSQGSVIVSWDQNSENDLAGYRVYCGTASRDYHTVFDVGNSVTYQVNDLLTNKRYYFAVTAYDTAGNESDFSKEVSIILEVESEQDSVETEKTLQVVYNFPNPFRLSVQNTNIRYFLEKDATVSIKIYDLNNQLIRVVLDDQHRCLGEHIQDYWDGKNSNGEFVASGIYLCKIEVNDKYRVIRIAAFR